MLKRYLAFAVLSLVAVILVLYVVDSLLLRLKLRNPANAFGTVTVRRYYAVPQKSGKYEFLYADPQDQTCVHALFPHLGDQPCWYLVRHAEQRINL